ncbi:MAG: shikimate kinase [Bacteroidota bacterium]
MRIYLIGFMTAGKTTLGRQLAADIGWDFIDLDEVIISREGKDIASIFAEEGEDYFRLVEREALEASATTHRSKVIFATGGGLPCFFDNMDRLQELGTSIYLQLPANELLRRIRKDRADRPLVRDKSPEELEDFVKQLLAKRQAFYERANHILRPEQQNLVGIKAVLR